MNFYLTTAVSPKIITPILQKLVNREQQLFPIPENVQKKFYNEYEKLISFPLSRLPELVTVTKVGRTQLCVAIQHIQPIYQMLQYLEFGNRTTEAPQLISKIMRKSLDTLDNMLGGL